jgi:uncharacterized protein involved in tolerance to divalent cations
MGSKPRLMQTTTDNAEALERITDTLAGLGISPRVEEIQSYYWWDGRVVDEAESRISFESTLPLEEVIAAVGAVHNYDAPMIIGEVADGEPSNFWRGVIQDGTAAMAAELAGARLVACAQLSHPGASGAVLAVKTVAACKPLIEARVGRAIGWSAIDGNKKYLDWVSKETAPSL